MPDVNRWIGGAANAVQVDDVTPANVENTDIFKITLADDAGNSNEISFTATAGTVQNVVEGLQTLAAAAKAAGTAPWTAVTVTDDDTKVIITSDTSGVPFDVTTSTVDGGGTDDQTLVRSVSTARSSADDWKVVANWSLGAIPVATDIVVFEDS